MTTNLAPSLFQTYSDANGNPLSGGKIYTYLAGTTTPQATYTDSTGGTPNTNPVILDSSGRAAIWLDPTLSYKFVLKDSSDVQIGDPIDNVIGVLTADAVATDAIQDSAVTNSKLAAGAVSGSKMGFTTASKTADYTLTAADSTILADASSASITLSLPTATTCAGRIYVVKRIDNTIANSVTLDPNGSETIDLNSTLKLMTQWESVTLLSNGTYWNVIAHKCGTAPVSYSLTIGGSSSAPSTGTVQTNIAQWYRDDGDMVITFQFRQTSSGTTGSGTYLFPLPSGATIDTNRCSLTNLQIGETCVGHGHVYDSASYFVVAVRPYDSTHLALSDGSGPDVGSGHVALSGSDVRMSFTARIPITDWWA